LRDFSRQSSEDAEAVPTNVNDMVQEAVEITKPRLNRINLMFQLGEPPATLIRPADCVTAIVNLLLNAADALEGNGVITVSTGSSDQCAWIEVADNGPGMSPDVKSKVLEPFFTTKGEGGTGLGLPIVYAFTERYGGRLEIESELGHGAKFRIFLPAILATEHSQ